MYLKYNFHLFYKLQRKKTGDMTFHYVNQVFNSLFRNPGITNFDSVWYNEKKKDFDFCGASVLIENFSGKTDLEIEEEIKPNYYGGKRNLTTNDIEIDKCQYEV